VLLEEHRQLQESREGVVEQLLTAREVNGETSQLIADLEEKIKLLEQAKLGLELKQIKLKGEVETLKRKRRSTPSPPPARPATTPKLRILQRREKESTAAMEFSLSPSSLPPTKKSRSRAKRWDQPAPGQERKVPSPARTPDNLNGKRREEQSVKGDPVLYASLNSFRNKKDVEEEIRRSSKALGHGSKGSEEVFHRRTIADQVKVIVKANAYVEVIIADTCKWKIQGDRGTMSSISRNPVQVYLGGFTVQQVRELHAEVQTALSEVMDTNRTMSSYTVPGPESGINSLKGCFFYAAENFPKSSPMISPKGPYKANDDNRALHQRLSIHNRHSIPIGFYYVKWLENLRFHLDNREEERRSSSSSSDSSRSSQRSRSSRAEDGAKIRSQRSPEKPKVDYGKEAPSEKSLNQVQSIRRREQGDMTHADRLLKQRAERDANKMASSSAAAPRKATHKELLEKRAAILDVRASTKLGIQDKAVFNYREERELQFFQGGHGMEERAFNAQYDSDQQFYLLQTLLEECDNNNNNEGHGSAEQGHR
jgi:hypothetical protein